MDNKFTDSIIKIFAIFGFLEIVYDSLIITARSTIITIVCYFICKYILSFWYLPFLKKTSGNFINIGYYRLVLSIGALKLLSNFILNNNYAINITFKESINWKQLKAAHELCDFNICSKQIWDPKQSTWGSYCFSLTNYKGYIFLSKEAYRISFYDGSKNTYLLDGTPILNFDTIISPYANLMETVLFAEQNLKKYDKARLQISKSIGLSPVPISRIEIYARPNKGIVATTTIDNNRQCNWTLISLQNQNWMLL